MKVLVTGGAGFIGAHVVRALLRTGVDEVRVLDDLSTGSLDNLRDVEDKIRFVQGSILDQNDVNQTVAGIDSIIHLAARPSVPRSLQDPKATHSVNVTGSMEVLEAARAADAYVCVASSSSVYGANTDLPKRESMVCRPMSPYAVSKLAMENYALAYETCFGLPVLAFRFFNVFGPFQAAGHAYAAVVPAFVSAALAGEPLTIHGDGLQTRDFTYVETVAEILSIAAVERITSVQPVNLAFGTRTSLLELIQTMEELLGHRLGRRFTERRPGDVRDSQADNTALRSLFPDVSPVPLRDALLATIQWARSTWSVAS